jgi:hypothetical protein
MIVREEVQAHRHGKHPQRLDRPIARTGDGVSYRRASPTAGFGLDKNGPFLGRPGSRRRQASLVAFRNARVPDRSGAKNSGKINND